MLFHFPGPTNPSPARRRRHPDLHAGAGRHRGHLRGFDREAGRPGQRAAVDSASDLLAAARRPAGQDLPASAARPEEVYRCY